MSFLVSGKKNNKQTPETPPTKKVEQVMKIKTNKERTGQSREPGYIRKKSLRLSLF